MCCLRLHFVKKTHEKLPNLTPRLTLMDQKLITGEEGYIFVNSSKKAFYSHDIIGVNFQKLLAKCGVQARVLYNLRHTFDLRK